MGGLSMLLLAGEHALGTSEVSQSLILLHSPHAGGREHKHLYSVHTVSSAVSLFTAHEQTTFIVFIKIYMCIILCLEGNRSCINKPKWTQTQVRYRF